MRTLKLWLVPFAMSLVCAASAVAADDVFTIFCHGTGGHRAGRDRELITEFSAAYWGRGTTDQPNSFYEQHYQNSFLILDGVGTSDMFITAAGTQVVGLATQTRPDHPMPGDFRPDSFDKKPLKPSASSLFNVSLDTSRGKRVSSMGVASLAGQKHRGDIYGDGWDDNVAHALFVLKARLDQGQFPKVINMIGWSRGAVTCLKLSNAIHDYFVAGQPYLLPDDYKNGMAGNRSVVYPALPAQQRVADVELNLFLIDPVPGRFGVEGEEFGSKRSLERFPPNELDYQHLPHIVRRCIITLANDEQREGFAPLDADDISILDPARSTVVWLPFPGIHRTQLRMEPRDPVDQYNNPPVRHKLTAVPHLVWDLAWKFLTQHGTKFQRNVLAEPKFGGRPLTAHEVVDLYAEVWSLRMDYHQARNRGITSRIQGGLEARQYTGYPFRNNPAFNDLLGIPQQRERKHLFTAQMGTYVAYPGFFVNEHHRSALADAYPQLYQYLTAEGPHARDSGGNFPLPGAAAGELQGRGNSKLVQMQLQPLGLYSANGQLVASANFRFAQQLGEPLWGGAPAAPRFTGRLEKILPGGDSGQITLLDHRIDQNSPSSQGHFFKLHSHRLAANQTYQLRVDADFQPWLLVYDPASTLLAQSAVQTGSERTATLHFTPPAAAEYRIMVTSRLPGMEGQYRLSSEPPLDAGPAPPPVGEVVTVRVSNSSSEHVRVVLQSDAANVADSELGFVQRGTEQSFEVRTGATVRVDGSVAVTQKVSGADQTIRYTGAPAPDPVPGRFRVTVSLVSMTVDNDGDARGSGELYWNIQLQRPQGGEVLSQRQRNQPFSADTGQTYTFEQLQGGTPAARSFEIARGDSFSVAGSVTESDAGDRFGSDDFFGSFQKSFQVSASLDESFDVQLVESNPDFPPPGKVTLRYKVTVQPIP